MLNHLWQKITAAIRTGYHHVSTQTRRLCEPLAGPLQNWWQQREERERYILKYGGIILTCFIVYVWMWLPLKQAVQQQTIISQQNTRLLTWFRLAIPSLQAYQRAGWDIEKISQTYTTPPSSQNIMSQAESSLSQAGLTSFLTHIQQITADQNNQDDSSSTPSTGNHLTPMVSLSFKAVPFAKLQTWLLSIWQSQHVALTGINLKKSTATGTVDATLQLGF